MLTAAGILYAPKWKEVLTATMEKWNKKMMKLVKMAKMTALIRVKVVNSFIVTWKPFLDFMLGKKKMKL